MPLHWKTQKFLTLPFMLTIKANFHGLSWMTIFQSTKLTKFEKMDLLNRSRLKNQVLNFYSKNIIMHSNPINHKPKTCPL